MLATASLLCREVNLLPALLGACESRLNALGDRHLVECHCISGGSRSQCASVVLTSLLRCIPNALVALG